MNIFEGDSKLRNIARGTVLAGGLAIAAAGCGTPKPAEASLQRPNGTEIFDMVLDKYQTFPVKEGDILLGDYSLGPVGTSIEDFKKDAKTPFDKSIQDNPAIEQAYDTTPNPTTGIDNKDTGNITIIEADGFAYTDGWKAALIGNLPADKQQEYIMKYKKSMEKIFGCTYEATETSCKGGVTVLDWTTNGLTPDPRFK